MLIRKLSDMEIYKMSLTLAQQVYKLTKQSVLIKDFSLIDQIRRSSLSVSANIAEGYGRKTNKDFTQFLSIALGSANETIAFLDFIGLEYKIDIQNTRSEYELLTRKIYAFRRYLTSLKK